MNSTDTSVARLSTALGESLVQYQSVYDARFNLTGVRLNMTSANSALCPPWHDVLSAISTDTVENLGPVVLEIDSAQRLDGFASNMVCDGSFLHLTNEVAGDPGLQDQLATMHAAGLRFAMSDATNGTSTQRLAGLADEVTPVIVRQGISTLDELEQAFAGNSTLGIGWPVNGNPGLTPGQSGESNIQLILDLLQRIERAEHVDNIEPLLDKSPTLSYRLLKYLNSPASGLDREIDSLRHAVMLVGYGKLKSWLSMLLASAVDTPKARPLIDAAIRRAHLMQAFADCLGINQTDGDMFVCGVFSLLDQMLGKSMSELLEMLPLSEEAAQCLKDSNGPYAPYLNLVRNIESAQPFDYLAACDETALAVHEVNLATLTSLAKANATS